MQDKLGQDRPSRVERPLYISSIFLQWGNVYEWPRPLYQHGMVCSERKVKKDRPNQNRMLYNCPKEDACVSSSGSNKTSTRAIKNDRNSGFTTKFHQMYIGLVYGCEKY